MNLSYRPGNGIGVVRVHATRLDAAVAIPFKDQFSAAAITGEGADAGVVLLDLEEVEFLDSSGLGAVVAARKMLGDDRTLALAALRPAVEKVMRLTHMDRIFPIYPDAASCPPGQGSAEAV
ncbi:STAS domain-containing protein [Roseibacterium sp. SDUM158017]|uniref:STAS domain-containing protein n=1 Tax=Roseicyclus salinarum TaxID=3036773 RepID=UPI00241504DE|nr:STAS domain-containing protein [Roseibacterium sp. SDUM158017]MDG4650290.1 STAS domain-containing protein [Roseibacterium sp. SDUM158017]